MAGRGFYLVGGSALALLAVSGCQAILGLDEGTKRDDGQGGTSSSSVGGGGGACDPASCPAPESACRVAACDAQGACSVEDAPARTPCTEGPASLCDGQGACVECIDGGDCTGGDVCSGGACLPATCTDGTQNGSETGIDCGGPDCPFCPAVLLLGGGGSSIAAGEYRPGAGWTAFSLTGVTSEQPAVAITAAGEGAGLIRYTGGGALDDELLAASWNLTDGWSQFSTLGVGVRSAPASSAGSAGIQAVYQELNNRYHYAEWSNGVWSPVAETVGNGGGQSIGPSAPALAVRGTDAVAAFVNSAASNHLFVRRRLAGVWQNGEDIALDPDPAIPPEIVVLPGSQDLLVTFVRIVDHQVLATRWNGVAWQFPAPIANAVTNERAALAALPGDEAVLAFRGSDGMLYTSRYNGSQWSAPAGIASPNVAIASTPAVTHGITGAEIELVYVNAQSAVFHTRYAGGAWTAPASIVMSAGLTRVAIASVP